MEFGNGAFGRYLGDEHGALVKGISAFRKHRVRTQGDGASYEPGRGSSPECDQAGALILGFPAPRNVRYKFLLFISHSVCCMALCYSRPD